MNRIEIIDNGKETVLVETEQIVTVSQSPAANIVEITTPTGQVLSTFANNLLETTSALEARNLLLTQKFITPEQFGCVGDGTTDDTVNFQAAVDTLTPGMGLVLRPGAVYGVQNVDLPGAFIRQLKYWMGCVGGTAQIKCIAGGDTDYLVATKRWKTGATDGTFSGHSWRFLNVVFDANNIAEIAFVLQSYENIFWGCDFANGTVTGCMLTRQNQDASLGTTGYNANNMWIQSSFYGNATYALRNQGTASNDDDASSDGFILGCTVDGRAADGLSNVTDYGFYIAGAPGWHIDSCHTFGCTTADIYLSQLYKIGAVSNNTFEELMILNEIGFNIATIGPNNKLWGGARVDFTDDTSTELVVFRGNSLTEDTSFVEAVITHNNNRSQKTLFCVDNDSIISAPFVLAGGNTNGVIRTGFGNFSEGLGREITRTDTARITGTSAFFTAFFGTSTEASANAGPYLLLDRNSASPANNDFIGAIAIQGRNSAAETIQFTYSYGQIIVVTDAAESGKYFRRGYEGGSDVLFYESGGGYIRTEARTVANLPSASSGARAVVSDANATTFASVVAGGGANTVPVYSDGTNWRIG